MIKLFTSIFCSFLGVLSANAESEYGIFTKYSIPENVEWLEPQGRKMAKTWNELDCLLQCTTQGQEQCTGFYYEEYHRTCQMGLFNKKPLPLVGSKIGRDVFISGNYVAKTATQLINFDTMKIEDFSEEEMVPFTAPAAITPPASKICPYYCEVLFYDSVYEHGFITCPTNSNTCYVYHWYEAGWTMLPNERSLLYQHNYGRGLLLWDDRYMLVGGYEQAHITPHGNVEYYSEGIWHSWNPAPKNLYLSSLVQVSHTQVLCIGGAKSKDVFMFDMEENTWTAKPSIIKTADFGAAAKIGNYVYFAGGDGKISLRENTYSFDLTTEVWTRLDGLKLPYALAYPASITRGRKWYIALGYTNMVLYTPNNNILELDLTNGHNYTTGWQIHGVLQSPFCMCSTFYRVKVLQPN